MFYLLIDLLINGDDDLTVAIHSMKGKEGRRPYMVFGPLIREESSMKSKYLDKELNEAKDSIFSNIKNLPPEQALNHIVDGLIKSGQPDKIKVRTIAFVLLSLRDQRMLEKFYDIVQGRFKHYKVSIGEELSHYTRRMYDDFLDEPTKNLLFMFVELCKAEDIQFLKSLAMPIISSIDTGCYSDQNFRLYRFFAFNVKNFPQIWKSLLYEYVLLVIKFLRLYQDVSIISDMINQNNLLMKLDKMNADLYNHFEKLTINFAPDFVKFFQLNTDLIFQSAYKEVVRILYDPRIIARMQARFPILYQLANTQTAYQHTSGYINQVSLPYIRLCQMLQANSDLQNYPKAIEHISSMLRRDRCKPFVDIDTILSDCFRSYLNSIDYANQPTQVRSVFIQLALRAARDLGDVDFRSSILALIIDMLYINMEAAQLDKVYSNTLQILIYPVAMLINPQEPLSLKIIQTLADIMHLNYSRDLKRNSIKFVFGLLPSIYEFIQQNPNIKDSTRNELISFLKSKEKDVIPPELKNFKSSNIPLGSPEGREIIMKSNKLIKKQLEKVQGDWKKIAPNIIKIRDSILTQERTGVEHLFDGIDPTASAIMMSLSAEDATIFLHWVALQNKYEVFNQNNIFKMSFYAEALSNEIRDQTFFYKPFLTDCTGFRSRQEVIKAICLYCPTSVVFDFSELPMFQPSSGYIDFKNLFEICQNWPPDAIENLVSLISPRFITPSDFHSIAEVFAAYYSRLPDSIVYFFLNSLMLNGSSKQSSEFLQVLSRSSKSIDTNKSNNSLTSQDFIQTVKTRWLSIDRTSKAPTTVHRHASDEVIL